MTRRFDMIGQGDCEMSMGDRGEYVEYETYAELEKKYTTLRFKYDEVVAEIKSLHRMIDP